MAAIRKGNIINTATTMPNTLLDFVTKMNAPKIPSIIEPIWVNNIAKPMTDQNIKLSAE